MTEPRAVLDTPRMASDRILDIRGLCVIRDRQEILSDVDWRIRRGEHWALFGANGSGKTTLLSALLTYVPPARGEIEVLGQRYGASDWRLLRKRIGIVSDSAAQRIPAGDDALSVVCSGTEARFGNWGADSSEIRGKALALLTTLGCEHLTARRFAVLSSGERQRVLIARALMASPELLFLDEPCANLDVVAREEFLDQIDRLASTAGGPSLVMVTHHAEEISPHFCNTLLLARGRVLASGESARVLTQPNLERALEAPLRVQAVAGRVRVELLRPQRERS